MKNPIENKIVKWFIRVLTGIILGAYTLTIVQKVVIADEPLAFSGQDYGIIIGCLTIWLAFESAVAWLKRKVEKDE